MKYDTLINQQLSQIENQDKGKPRKKILILGAGMAGLAAGYELAQRGHEVQLFEASSRLGGRVWTKRFKNGQYGEFGAMRIPDSHDYSRYYIERFNLKLRPFINTNPETYRDFEGNICKAKDAPKKIGDLFDLSTRDREAIKGEHGLDAIYLRIMNDLLSHIDDGEKLHIFGQRNIKKKKKHFDTHSLLQTLRNYADTYDAVRLMGKTVVLDDYWHRSTIMFIREEIDAAFNGLEEIDGGMDKLPNALADAPLPHGTKLRDHIAFFTEVYSIDQGNEGVTITFKQNGKLDKETFSYVLCTIPFSVLRRIDIKGVSVNKKIKDAIQGLEYHSATKVLVNCKQRFWESHDKIFGGASLTDSIARMTFYPSDNCKQKPEISNSPGVLLGSYTWGATARRLGVLSQKERGELVIEKIERFHGKIRDYLDSDEPYYSMAWDQYPFSAGAFASPSPNDLQMFFPEASRSAGRLFFAGEHLSPYQSWIQGGLWSALQAVMQIVLA